MLSNERARGIFWQVLLIAVVGGIGWYLFTNTLHNLSTRQIQVGFAFLDREAGFEISEKRIEYDPSMSYARALFVGVLNTLHVSAIGIVIATVLGSLIGISRLSSNWLLSRLASAYVEVMRNIPLLLQLFVWYGLFTMLPGVRQSIAVGEWLFLNQRGLRLAWPAPDPAWMAMFWTALVALALSALWRRHARKHQAATGRPLPVFFPSILLILGLPLVTWALMGTPSTIEFPKLAGFNFQGGINVTPEFMALLIGLSTYTAAFIAEVVRAGILAVARGQTEAAMSLGLSPGQRLRLVTLPQALRVIIPPMTSQYLNLTKNSSLAVAVGYPDLVSVANTTMNQTGQALEAIAILMAVYLTISLAISAFMNWYNQRVRLVER
jgi:general L-amino acid transport system permease protein